MNWDALWVGSLAVVSLLLLVSGKLTLDMAGLALIGLLVLSRQVELQEALAGFGNPTVVTLAALYVLGESLTRTGALEFLGRVLLRMSGHKPIRLLWTLCLAMMVLSAFASNTAVMLVFLPLALRLAGELNVPPSRFLIPMAFSSIFGGSLTLVGSSINLLTSGVAETVGADPIGFFELTPVALPLALVGVALTVIWSGRLLPDRHSLSAALAVAPVREYITEMHLGEHASWLGEKVDQAFENHGVQILSLIRDQRLISPPFENQVFEAGDGIMVQGPVNQLAELQQKPGISAVDDIHYDLRTMTLFEVGLSPQSALGGRKIGDLHIWRDYGLVVVAVLRGRHHIRERVRDLTLQVGDLLLVCGQEEAIGRVRASSDFFLLSDPTDRVVLRRHGRRALGVLAAVVAMFSMGAIPALQPWLPIPLVALCGAAAVVVLGCISPARAYRSIDYPILVFVAGALALGKAMESSGLAASCAHAIVAGLQPLGPAVVVSGLLLVGTLLNQFTSPYAVTVLLTPIALATAKSMGVEDLRPFILAIAFAGSNAFATPFGHQVNLMVLGPGGYRYSDFLRLGLPLCLYFWVSCSLLLAL
ncbi:MAG: hypothetical protein DWQ01_06445 [Planctomycetota bacterium]|nr:MAG: hypothetical protein DWQ01_06445 [Planctomycetota bacterium]